VLLSDGIGESDCESIGDGLFAQPVNAATSLAYVLAGLVLWLRLPEPERFRAGGLYALFLALIGAGSVIYHGLQQIPGARLMHDVPIPALLTLIVAVVLWRWRQHALTLPGLSRWRLWTVVIVFIGAPVAYALGRTGSPVCDADSELQPHGLWHMLTAFGFLVVGEILFRPAAQSAQPEPVPGDRPAA
jgi:hypothetical protein